MRIRPEILPFLPAAVLISAVVYGGVRWTGGGPGGAGTASGVVLAVLAGYVCWFFRDPVRIPPDDPDAILAAADGVVANTTSFPPEAFGSIAMLAGLNPADTVAFSSGEVIRISIFLSLFDVHVNRAPIKGRSRFLGYFPGKHLFTFTEKSSDVNQHNSILIENERTTCLVNQIVGPICRRVVYWPDPERAVAIAAGEAFGMMKFGSRLDMYFPARDVSITVSNGDRVTAGRTVIGRYRKPT